MLHLLRASVHACASQPEKVYTVRHVTKWERGKSGELNKYLGLVDRRNAQITRRDLEIYTKRLQANLDNNEIF